MSALKMNMRAGLTASMFLLLLAGCDADMESLNRYIAEVKQRPADPIEPIPPVATFAGATPLQPALLPVSKAFRTT